MKTIRLLGALAHDALGCYQVASDLLGSDMESQMEKILADLASNRDLLNHLRHQGMSYAGERLTWDAKAQATSQVLNWAVRGLKPNLSPPKICTR